MTIAEKKNIGDTTLIIMNQDLEDITFKFPLSPSEIIEDHLILFNLNKQYFFYH